MSSIKYTRYLQVNEVMMLEYDIRKGKAADSENTGFIYTKLKDGHYLLFSGASDEVEASGDGGSYVRRSEGDLITNNTINHLAVPADHKCSVWYTFLDNNYEFNTPGNTGTAIAPDDVKVAEYARYCEPVEEAGSVFTEIKPAVGPGFDTVRIYLVNGYDFSGMYGILMRLYVERTDGGYLDLCNFFFTKATGSRMVKFLPEPIIFGNSIYDRYIELNVPSVYGIWELPETGGVTPLKDVLRLKEFSPLRISMSDVNGSDYDMKPVSYGFGDMIRRKTVLNDKVNCTFIRTTTINGAIPTEKLTSDNLGAYVGDCPDRPFVEFYGTWKDRPLDFETVLRFNKTIHLYDRSLMTSSSKYEVDKDYEPGYDYSKWVAVHEIRCCVCAGGDVLKEDRYSMTQVFDSPKKTSDERFYYRPIVFDTDTALAADNMKIEYTVRFINVNDAVQFIKTATYSTTDMDRFYAKACRLGSADMINYTVYNRIEEPKRGVAIKNAPVARTKYVKVFYDSSDVLLEDNDGAYYAAGGYVRTLSRMPKNYKFTVKRKVQSGAYDYMDLSDGYYKLVAKAQGGDIIIEPTYSSNMNMLLGELEFHLNAEAIRQLEAVPSAERKMSIVSYNADNSVYSLYDFSYAF